MSDNVFKDFMTYTRGPDDDFNRWALQTEDLSWLWLILQQFYYKVCFDILQPHVLLLISHTELKARPAW